VVRIASEAVHVKLVVAQQAAYCGHED
jgi:hypothetical protein